MSQTITLDATPGLGHQVLHCHQGDVGREVKIAIVSRDGYEVPSGATVKIEATKPSGMGFTITGTVTDNIVTFETTNEMTDECGQFPAQCRISSGDTLIFTSNFLLTVEENAHPDTVVDGSIDQFIPEMTLLVERAETAAATVEDAASLAPRISAAESDIDLLDARIDQIIAPSGSAPSAAEVTDARIGADGVTYSSLGTAIRTQVTDLKSESNGMASYGLHPVTASNVQKGYYNDGTYGSSDAMRALTFSARKGDVFKIECYIEWYDSMALVTEFDSNNTLVSQTHANSSDISTYYVVTGDNTDHIVIIAQVNQNLSKDVTVKKYTNAHVPTRYTEYKELDSTEYTVQSQKWYYFYGNETYNRDDANLIIIPCVAGEKYYIRNYAGFGEMAECAICFASSINPFTVFNKIAISVNTVTETYVEVPSGANYIMVNTTPTSYDLFKKEVSKTFIDATEYEQKTKKVRFLYNSGLGYCFRYKYTPTLDCAFRFKKKDTNQNFGMANIAHLANTGELVKETFDDFTEENNFYSLQSEWLSPYGDLKAVNNADGDFTSGLTGGNHTLGNNVATMTNESITVYVDGIETDVVEDKLYRCDKVEFIVVNNIQACNTVKTDGTGRTVVKEIQHITVTIDNVDVVEDIVFLEECTLASYYFAQQEIFAWQNKMWLMSDSARKSPWVNDLTDYNGSVKGNCIINGWKMHNGNGEYSECVIDSNYGFGNRTLINADTPTAITRSYGKFYSWLIDTKTFQADDTVSLHCHYRFWNQD